MSSSLCRSHGQAMSSPCQAPCQAHVVPWPMSEPWIPFRDNASDWCACRSSLRLPGLVEWQLEMRPLPSEKPNIAFTCFSLVLCTPDVFECFHTHTCARKRGCYWRPLVHLGHFLRPWDTLEQPRQVDTSSIPPSFPWVRFGFLPIRVPQPLLLLLLLLPLLPPSSAESRDTAVALLLLQVCFPSHLEPSPHRALSTATCRRPISNLKLPGLGPLTLTSVGIFHLVSGLLFLIVTNGSARFQM